MGLFDSLAGELESVVSKIAGPELLSLLPTALAATNLGDLQGVVNQLQQAGLGQQVQAWASGGPAPTLTPDMLKSVLGSEQVQQLAKHFGVDPDAALNALAQHLPTAVAQAAQDGTVQTSN